MKILSDFMKILGLHIGHDSGASLIIDEKIIADAAEERFTRVKHYCGFPFSSIDYCLKEGKISVQDIDYIALAGLYLPQETYNTINYVFNLGEKLQLKPERTYKQIIFGYLLKYTLNFELDSYSKPPLYIKRYQLSDKTKIIPVEHHLAHAASAYFTSGIIDKSLIVTIDGYGDGYSICIWRGENQKIIPIKKFPVTASIGFFYSNVTEALGWWHGDGEGKTMGLAPYGDFSKIKGILDPFYPKFKNGDLIEPHDFGRAYHWNERGAIQWHFDESYEIKKLIDIYGRENIAAEAQRILEEEIMNLILPWLDQEQTLNLCCAGGVFLNVKLNQKIWYTGKLKNQFIFPNPGDSGLSLGAALTVSSMVSPQHSPKRITNLYWGPKYSEAEITKFLKSRKIPFMQYDNISQKTAELLAGGYIIGWFQNRMESGPRALGARSILMSPINSENKDIINAKVKFREKFRPFCPTITDYAMFEYLDQDARFEEFMITSFNVNPARNNEIPAVVHVDGTVRPQIIKREENPRYYDLIKYFGEITGVPVLLNTSFNIRGEPIINSPSDAIRCFIDTGLDCLVLENCLISKLDEKIDELSKQP
jgi:carbamoyltransferase